MRIYDEPLRLGTTATKAINRNEMIVVMISICMSLKNSAHSTVQGKRKKKDFNPQCISREK